MTAAGSIPIVGYPTQALAAGRGIKDPSHRSRAEGTQLGSSVAGDVVGGLGGAHAAAYGAKHSASFRRGAESVGAKIDGFKSSLGFHPKPLKPAGSGGGAAGRAVRAATKPLRGKYRVAA